MADYFQPTCCSPVEEEQFTLDGTGNWPGYVVQQNRVTTLSQSRTHQSANEITSVGATGSTVAYDPNGNMTTIPQVDNWSTAQTLTYDAWNRPVVVRSGATPVGTYRYDGLNRRIWKQSLESGTSTTRHFYYSKPVAGAGGTHRRQHHGGPAIRLGHPLPG